MKNKVSRTASGRFVKKPKRLESPEESNRAACDKKCNSLHCNGLSPGKKSFSNVVKKTCASPEEEPGKMKIAEQLNGLLQETNRSDDNSAPSESDGSVKRKSKRSSSLESAKPIRRSRRSSSLDNSKGLLKDFSGLTEAADSKRKTDKQFGSDKENSECNTNGNSLNITDDSIIDKAETSDSKSVSNKNSLSSVNEKPVTDRKKRSLSLDKGGTKKNGSSETEKKSRKSRSSTPTGRKRKTTPEKKEKNEKTKDGVTAQSKRGNTKLNKKAAAKSGGSQEKTAGKATQNGTKQGTDKKTVSESATVSKSNSKSAGSGKVQSSLKSMMQILSTETGGNKMKGKQDKNKLVVKDNGEKKQGGSENNTDSKQKAPQGKNHSPKKCAESTLKGSPVKNGCLSKDKKKIQECEKNKTILHNNKLLKGGKLAKKPSPSLEIKEDQVSVKKECKEERSITESIEVNKSVKNGKPLSPKKAAESDAKQGVQGSSQIEKDKDVEKASQATSSPHSKLTASTSPAAKKSRLSLKSSKEAKPSAVQRLTKAFDKMTPKEADPAKGFPAMPVKVEEKTQTPTSTKEKSPGVAALDNIGNTCYLNSVLQVLRHTPSFSEKISILAEEIGITEKDKKLEAEMSQTENPTEEDEDDDDEEPPLAWKLVKYLRSLFARMSRLEVLHQERKITAAVLKPEKLMNVICEINPMFEGNMQQDAHELLMCILCLVKDAVKDVNQYRKQQNNKAVVQKITTSVNTSDVQLIKGKRLSFDDPGKISDCAAKSGPLDKYFASKSMENCNLKPKDSLENFSGMPNGPVGTEKDSQLAASPRSKGHKKVTGMQLDEDIPLVASEMAQIKSKFVQSNAQSGTGIIEENQTPTSGADVSTVLTSGGSGGKRKRSVSLSDTEMCGGKKPKNFKHCGLNPAGLKKKRLPRGQSDTSVGLQQASLTDFVGSMSKSKKRASDPLVVNQCHAASMQCAFPNQGAEKVTIVSQKGNNICHSPPSQTLNTQKSPPCSSGGKSKKTLGIRRMCAKSQFNTKTELNTIGTSDQKTNDVSTTHKSTGAYTHKESGHPINMCSKNASLNSSKICGMPPHLVKIPPGSPVKLTDFFSRPKVTLEKGKVHRYLDNEAKRPPCRQRDKVEDCIDTLFQGTMALRTQCQDCECYTERKESFKDVSVALKKRKKQIEDSDSEDESKEEENNRFHQILSAFSESEHLRGENKYYCDTCLHLVEARRFLQYQEMPTVLTLHLKRFAASAGAYGFFSKITDHVATPLTLPCLSELCAKPCSKKNHRYELYAMITHTGISLSSGHYVAYIRVPPEGHTSSVALAYLQQKLSVTRTSLKQTGQLLNTSKPSSPKPSSNKVTVTCTSEQPHSERKEKCNSSENCNGEKDSEAASSSLESEAADPNNNADANNNVSASLSTEIKGERQDAGSEDGSPKAETKPVVEPQMDEPEIQGQWIECDDAQITVYSEEKFKKMLSPGGQCSPYLLFYKQSQS